MFALVFKHTKRLIVSVVGVTVIGIGLTLLVLPGPGLLVIIVGLAILASEFVWAKRLLEHTRGHYERAKLKVVNRRMKDSIDKPV